MINETFSESFSRRKNYFSKIDCRIKIILVFSAILAVISSKGAGFSSSIMVLAVSCLLIARIPLKIIILRLTQPLGIAVTILVIKILFLRESPNAAVLTFLRILSSTSLVVFLSLTAPLDDLLKAGRWFRFPDVWIEICLIAYRYIFVLLEDALTVFDAQRVRLGYVNLKTSLSSIGVLAGMIIIRAYDQSIQTYEAMLARGYNPKD